MKEIISKELFEQVCKPDFGNGKVFQKGVYEEFRLERNTLRVCIFQESYNESGKGTGLHSPYNINIHELADKTINWIEKQDFWIRRPHKNIYELIHGGIEVYSIDTKERLKVPFMCGKWILTNNQK